MRSPSQWLLMRNQLRKYRFDIAIDPQGLTKSAILGWLSGAQCRIGAKGRWGRELSPYLNNELIEPKTEHVCDRSLALLEKLGIRQAAAKYEMPLCQTSLNKMRSFVNDAEVGSTFVIINPGASWPSKRWLPDRFAAVANYLKQSHSVKSVITWAGQEEQQMANEIVGAAPGAAILAPPTSLRELAALCHLAAFFLGCDTGPLHIAAAVGKRCIGLYGTTRPTESGAYGPQHFAIQKWYQAGSCRKRRSAVNQAMLDIQVSDVCAVIDELMQDEFERCDQMPVCTADSPRLR